MRLNETLGGRTFGQKRRRRSAVVSTKVSQVVVGEKVLDVRLLGVSRPAVVEGHRTVLEGLAVDVSKLVLVVM